MLRWCAAGAHPYSGRRTGVRMKANSMGEKWIMSLKAERALYARASEYL